MKIRCSWFDEVEAGNESNLPDAEQERDVRGGQGTVPPGSFAGVRSRKRGKKAAVAQGSAATARFALCVSHPDTNTVLDVVSTRLLSFVAATDVAMIREYPSRDEALRLVEKALCSLWPGARCSVFGSSATGLALPGSDLDVLLELQSLPTAERDARALERALPVLACQPWARDLRCASFPVPLLSLRVSPASGSLVSVDISLDVPGHQGVAALRLVRLLCARDWRLRPLVLALKTLLCRAALNNSYTGGLSSYQAVLLVAAFLKDKRYGSCRGAGIDGLGRLFLDALRFLGHDFDPGHTVVDLNDVRCFLPRTSGGTADDGAALYIRNPILAGGAGAAENVARGCFRMADVQRALASASSTLDALAAGGRSGDLDAAMVALLGFDTLGQ
jgi:DNA polymerase sigma